MAGVALASVFAFSTPVWFGLAFVSLLVGLGLRRLRPQATFSILLLPGFLFLGAARYQMVQPVITPQSIAYYNDLQQKVYVTGTLMEPPDIRDTYMNLHMQVVKVDTGQGDIPVHGVLLVRVSNEYEVQYGNLLRVRGNIQTPKENEEFSYRDYLATQGIYSTLSTSTVTVLPGDYAEPLWGMIYRIKDSLLKNIYKLFPNPEASLVGGILLGVDKNIPSEVQQAFQNTGTAHIIAISGFNIAILVAVFLALSSRVLGPKWGAISTILVIGFYVVLVGGSASVVRAGIMGTLSIIALRFGRRNQALTTLAGSALIMGVVHPYILWDVSFQLSFAATLGLLLYAQPMQAAVSTFLARYLAPDNVEKFVAPISEYFLLTFAAQLTTLPIIIYHFGRLSAVAFIANPLVLPAQPALMLLSGLAVVLSRVYMPLGQVVAWVAWPFAAYTIRVVEFFDRIPGGVLVLGSFGLLTALLCYVLLFGVSLAWRRVKGTLTPAFTFSLLAVFAVITWRSVLNAPDGRLHVTFLNAGSADSVLIETPSGKFIQINGGESPSVLSDQLGRRIPPLSRGIDLLVIASTQENQVAALPRTLEQYRPKSVLWAGNAQASFSSGRLDDWLTTNRIKIEQAKTGNAYSLGDGVTLRVLAVSNRGAVISVEMGNFKAVLPIGVNFDIFAELKNGQGLGPVTALLISESGYGPATPKEWLANLKPQVAILSVAAADPNGLPSKDLVTSLEKSTLLRTDLYGWIDLLSDGEQMLITTQNQK